MKNLLMIPPNMMNLLMKNLKMKTLKSVNQIKKSQQIRKNL